MPLDASPTTEAGVEAHGEAGAVLIEAREQGYGSRGLFDGLPGVHVKGWITVCSTKLCGDCGHPNQMAMKQS